MTVNSASVTNYLLLLCSVSPTVAINQVNRVVVFYLICLASEWVSDWINCLGVLNIVN